MAKKAIKQQINEYWQKRAENNFLSGEKTALQVTKELKSNYEKAYKEIQNKINAFYGKYASENGLTLEEAKQLLDRNELKDFKSYIAEMLKMGNKENFSNEQMYEFNRLYNKAKITRLEELQASIDYELDLLTSQNSSNLHDLLADSYEEGYYHTIYNKEMFFNTSKSFSGLNKQAIEKAVSTKWLGENYSSRIWHNTNNLTNVLTKEIPRGITLGYNPRKLAKQISGKLNANYNNTVRLIRTEYSHILNQATLDGYEATRLKQYQILTTLDNRRCDDCGEFEGVIVNIKEAVEGVNLPPFHPNCRCTTIPYFEKDEIDEMSDEELENIGFITYDDWKNGLVTLENNKVIYKGGLEND